MTEFDLKDIYTAVASYKGLPFPIGISQLPDYKIKQASGRIDFVKSLVKGGSNMYGQPVIMPVWIGDILLGGGKDDGTNITIQPMVTFEGEKKIVTNEIGGGTYAGSIKEFINYGDYKINIVGALVNRNQKEYPQEQLDLWKNRIWKPNEAQEFSCEISYGLFDYIVIKKMKLHELSKSPGIQLYDIEALSDAVIEVEQLKGE